MRQKFTLTFKNGTVDIVLIIDSLNVCWVDWFKCSKKKQGLGREALKLLNQFEYKPLLASKIIASAQGFWVKMQSEKLIRGYTVCHCKRCERFKYSISKPL
jgi:hypothetical protein